MVRMMPVGQFGFGVALARYILLGRHLVLLRCSLQHAALSSFARYRFLYSLILHTVVLLFCVAYHIISYHIVLYNTVRTEYANRP